MNHNLFPRGLAVLVMSLLLGTYINHNYKKWRRLGREAFIAHELERFDRYIAPPDSVGVALFGDFILVLFVFGLNELVAYILSNLLKPTAAAQTGPTGARGVPFT